MTKDNNEELFLIDASGYIFRAYYALAYSGGGNMTNPDGVPVSAVYGFTNMLMKLLKNYNNAKIVTIFDAGRYNFRNDIYEDYKANRDETPEDLIPQFPIVREAAEAFGLPAIEMEGYEADDLIATYAKQASAKGIKVKIISSDKDLMQLVDANINMFDPMKDIIVDEKGVFEKFGVTPDKVIDVQSLAGDSTDNVPGVPGIGIKTAALLINEYETLENLLENAESIKQNKRRETLIEHAEMARISKQLVTLANDIDVPVPLDDFKKFDTDVPSLKPFLEKQGFKSLLSRLGGNIETMGKSNNTMKSASNDDIKGEVILPSNNDFPPIKDNKYTLITNIETLENWLNTAKNQHILAIDTETTALTPAIAKLVGISIASEVGKAAYIPLQH
ncbi:MAG: 5'-3' exonuclease H3TH domain-containing protein, partial [Pseudomonadota bacterium]